MAIQEQHPYIDEKRKKHDDLTKHYSDEGLPIMKMETGEVYDEAIDQWPCPFHYEEVHPQPDDEEPEIPGEE